ncbi:MAG: thioesterase family protein [Gammaproteobacteria bacterium]|nr:thioesterase family protein [Gammaproteobacteria bacterium]
MIGDQSQILGQPVYEGSVQPEWIDANQHMNVAYYMLAFDLAVDRLWWTFGITDDHIREQRTSTFAVESHMTWQGEMNLNNPFVVTTQILAYDAKRIHQFQRMYHKERGYLAATCEWLNLHVDLRTRRVSPWPGDILEAIAAEAEGHNDFGLPIELGQRMQVRDAMFSVAGYE